MSPSTITTPTEGFILIDKPEGCTSFSLVAKLRRRLNVKKIGHTGTLDPFASGLMILLVGRNYTRLSDSFLCSDKSYAAEVHLGIATNTYDCEGTVTLENHRVPTAEEIERAVSSFQGDIMQVPPMFSAKKVAGKKLYELARQGREVEREAAPIRVDIAIVSYNYPKLHLVVSCSKGTYIRSLAHDIGQTLGCGAHLTALRRTRSGPYTVDSSIPAAYIDDPAFAIESAIKAQYNV